MSARPRIGSRTAPPAFGVYAHRALPGRVAAINLIWAHFSLVTPPSGARLSSSWQTPAATPAVACSWPVHDTAPWRSVGRGAFTVAPHRTGSARPIAQMEVASVRSLRQSLHSRFQVGKAISDVRPVYHDRLTGHSHYNPPRPAGSSWLRRLSTHGRTVPHSTGAARPRSPHRSSKR